MNNTALMTNYDGTLQSIKERIYKATYNALKAVNKELIELYWDLGKTIAEKQETEKWGRSTVEKLAKDLQIEFPGIKGYSARNLWYMKNFYETYKDNEKLQPLAAEISWSHNIEIMDRCNDDLEREFYIKMSIKMAWSKYTLREKIRIHEYEKHLNNQTNFAYTVDPSLRAQATWETKDDYAIDLLLTEDPVTEKTLEQSIVDNILKFLGEMGGNFAFLGRQYRVEFEGKEYFIDLLFYNLRLKCYVAIELKAVEFSPEHIGKMQLYLIALNEQVKDSSDNPSIGIIICKQKNRTVVEYMLKSTNQPVGVATYNHYSTLEELPETVAKYLPSEADIEKRLTDLLP